MKTVIMKNDAKVSKFFYIKHKYIFCHNIYSQIFCTFCMEAMEMQRQLKTFLLKLNERIQTFSITIEKKTK